jgi:hypothetical protein
VELDPEIIKAGMPLIGAALGGFIGVIGGWLVAQSNQAGARAIARDNARRDDLRDLLGPLRAQVAERTEQMASARGAALVLTTSQLDDEDQEIIQEASSALEGLKWRSDAETGAWAAAGNAEILELYREWSRLDRRCYANVRTVEREGAHNQNYGSDQEAMMAEYTAAAVKLTTAINDLLHGTAPLPVVCASAPPASSGCPEAEVAPPAGPYPDVPSARQ